MAKTQVHTRMVNREGKEVQGYFTSNTGGEEIPAGDVLKENASGLYFITEHLTDDEKKAIRSENNMVNLCKSVQKTLDDMAQATQRASAIKSLPDKAREVLLNDMRKALAAFEVAMSPRISADPKTKVKVFKYAHLLSK